MSGFVLCCVVCMSFVVCVCAVAGALLDTAFVFKALGDPLGILSGVSWGVFCGVVWGFLGISVGMEMRFAVRTEQ